MYYSLGSIIFEGLQGFSSIGYTEGMNYAEVQLVNRKPTLQATNSKLKKYDLGIQFNANYCVPENEFEKLSKASRERKVLPFTLGNGIFLGDFVITDISQTLNKLDGQGNVISMNCTLNLLEYVIENKIQKELNLARANAFGNNINKGIPGQNIEQPKSIAVEATEDNTLIDTSVFEIQNTTETTVNNPTAPQSNYNKIKGLCDVVSVTALELQFKVNALQSQLNNYSIIVDNCNAVINASNSLKASAEINDNVSMQMNAKTLNSANNSLQQSTAKTLIYKVVSRAI